MDDVRREEDGELCGSVDEHDGDWCALTVFGGVLGRHERRDDAVDQVLSDGLASLADRWTLCNTVSGDEQVVCIQEADPVKVTLALDYYSMPGVPTLTLTVEELHGGEWELRR